MTGNIEQELKDFGLQLDDLTSTYAEQYKAEYSPEKMSDTTVDEFINANKSQIDQEIEDLKSHSLSETTMNSKVGEAKMAVDGFFTQLNLHLKSIPDISDSANFGN